MPKIEATQFPILEANEPIMAPTSIRITKGPSNQGYARLLGISDATSPQLHALVKAGLPFGAMEHLQDQLDPALINLPQVVHIPARTLQRRKVEGRLQPDESDRLLRFARILWKTIQLFDGNRHLAVGWLTSPVVGLGGICPLELAQSEPGTQEVEALIGRLQYGVFS